MPIDRAALLAYVQAMPEASAAQPAALSKGYKIARVDYPSANVGVPRSVVITGGGPYEIILQPELGKLEPVGQGNWRYTASRTGMDQIQLRNGAGEVWLLMMSVR